MSLRKLIWMDVIDIMDVVGEWQIPINLIIKKLAPIVSWL